MVAYVTRECNEFLKLGLQGVTVLVASGDYGPSFEQICINPADPTNATLLNGAAADSGLFVPRFSASCPWVTAVGATQRRHNATVLYATPEVLWGLGPGNGNASSSGGFSIVFPMPSYQAKSVKNFFTTDDPSRTPMNQYDSSGKARGYPDVSANGSNYKLVTGSQPGLIGGTSLATPTFGSIRVMINQERLAMGQKPVGFINPTLYAHSNVLKDIVGGKLLGVVPMDGLLCKDWIQSPD